MFASHTSQVHSCLTSPATTLLVLVLITAAWKQWPPLTCPPSPVMYLFHPFLPPVRDTYLQLNLPMSLPYLQLFHGSHHFRKKTQASDRSHRALCNLHPLLLTPSLTFSPSPHPMLLPSFLPLLYWFLYQEAQATPTFTSICLISFYSSFKTQHKSTSRKPHLTFQPGRVRCLIFVGVLTIPMQISITAHAPQF